MTRRIIPFTAALAVSATLITSPLHQLHADEPGFGDDIRTSTAASDARVTAVTAQGFQFRAIREASEFEGSERQQRREAERANEALFDSFIDNEQNAGLYVPFLKQFDKRSLEILKEAVFDDGGSFWQEMSRVGANEEALKDAKDELWKDYKKEFDADFKRLKDLEEQYASRETAGQSEEVRQAMEGLRRALEAERERLLRNFRLKLNAIEDELDWNIFGRNSDNYGLLLGWFKDKLRAMQARHSGARSVQVSTPSGETVQRNLFQELESRITYVERLAQAADKSEPQKWAITYILSWYFTKDNIAIAMSEATPGSGDSDTDASAGDTDAHASTDTGSDTGADAGTDTDTDTASGEWTPETAAIMNELGEFLQRKTHTFHLDEEIKFENKSISSAFVGVIKTHYTKVNMPRVEADILEKYVPAAQRMLEDEKLANDNSEQAQEIKTLIQRFTELVEHMKAQKTRQDGYNQALQSTIDKYQQGKSVTDLSEGKNLFEFMKVMVQGGGTKEEGMTFGSGMKNFTQSTLYVAMATMDANDVFRALFEKYKEYQESNSAEKSAIVEWIKEFDQKRQGTDKPKYGNVMSSLVGYVKDTAPAKFPALNHTFTSNVTPIDCLSLLQTDFNSLKMEGDFVPSSLEVSVDQLEALAEKQVFCFANYEWRLKQKQKEGGDHIIFNDGTEEDYNFDIKVDTIYSYLGDRNATVKEPEATDYSLFEGLERFVKFAANFQRVFIAYLKKEFEERGKPIQDISSTQMSVASRDHDSVTFRFPSDVLFATGKHEVKTEGGALLSDSLPILLEVLGENKELIDALMIEGHADSRPFRSYTSEFLPAEFTPRMAESNTGNDGLSYDRAHQVWSYWNTNSGSNTSFIDFQRATGIEVSRSGKGSSVPILEDGSENMERSRRVEFKFSLDLDAIAAIRQDPAKLREWERKLNGDLSDEAAEDNADESSEEAPPVVEDDDSDASTDVEVGDETSTEEEAGDNTSTEEEAGDNTSTDEEAPPASETDDDTPADETGDDTATEVEQEDDTSSAASGEDLPNRVPGWTRVTQQKMDEWYTTLDSNGWVVSRGENDIYEVDRRFSSGPDGSRRQLTLKPAIHHRMKATLDWVKAHDLVYGTDYTEQYENAVSKYSDDEGNPQSVWIQRNSTTLSFNHDSKDQDYVLEPLRTDMGTVRSVLSSMRSDQNRSDAQPGAEWKSRTAGSLRSFTEAARGLNFPQNDGTVLYDYTQAGVFNPQPKVKLKPEVVRVLEDISLVLKLHESTMSPENSIKEEFEALKAVLVNEDGTAKDHYVSKPNRPSGGHARRTWDQNWRNIVIITPEQLAGKVDEVRALVERIEFQ